MDGNLTNETKRKRRRSTGGNLMIVGEAKRSVQGRLNTIGGICNGSLNVDFGVPRASFMNCVAKIYKEGSDEVAGEGRYNAGTSTHAEMNALAAYLEENPDFRSIRRIEISAPPCKSCAFVLNLLGVVSKVHTTKKIYKHFTGSWTWPDELQDTTLFNLAAWNKVKGFFDKSGLSDQQILEAVVNVVRTQSPL